MNSLTEYLSVKCTFIKVLLWSKIDFYFFFDISKALMFNTHHAKLQVFMSTRSVINWATISGFDRPPLQNSNMAGNNWESWGGRGNDVIQSRQQKQRGYFSMQQGFCSCVFLRIRSKFELNSSMTKVCQVVVVLCRIATTVQIRDKEFLYIILLEAAVFYQVGRDS